MGGGGVIDIGEGTLSIYRRGGGVLTVKGGEDQREEERFSVIWTSDVLGNGGEI